MNQQLSDLLKRYQRVAEQSASLSPEIIDHFNSLRLADATLDKIKLNEAAPDHPAQLVVLGPTQAGKSTLCNIILDENHAGISSLAGFTVHAQGFAINCEEAELKAIEPLFHPHTRVPADQLDPTHFDQFVLQSKPPGKQALISKGVVWDSPDFDSIDAAGYRGAVLQAAAVGDILILMVSKDKYADKSVWDMLNILQSLGKPLIICINKLDPSDEKTVFDSFEERFLQAFDSPVPQLISLPFVKTTSDTASAIDVGDAKREQLTQMLGDALNNADRTVQREYARRYIKLKWPQWIEPLQAEHQALQSWQYTVDEHIEKAKALYVSRYLENPQKYDTFNKAIAELLTFLEIPGLAGALSTTRNLVTWPVRKLFGMGKSTLTRETQPQDQEFEMLSLILEQTNTSLQGHILDEQQDNEQQHAWWHSLNKQFKQEKPLLKEHYAFTAKQLQTEFEPKIDEAAKQLFDQLQEQPLLLNSLRAARATTDAGAVVLAVKSGGLAAADLIIAPAMLSVTSLLTESVLGKYMDRVKQKLKDEQQLQINNELFEKILRARLLSLTSSIDNKSLLLGGDDFEFDLPV